MSDPGDGTAMDGSGAWRPMVAAGFLGAALAVVSETAGGLLLYAGPGLLESLSVVLAVQAGSLAAGLLQGGGSDPEALDRSLRGRWHFVLVTLSLAAATAGAWSFLGGLSRVPGGQAVGLALLGAMPLFAGGSVLAGLCHVAAGKGRGAGPAIGCGAAFLLGAAAGFLLYGLLLVSVLRPPVALILCVAVAAAGAMVHQGIELPWGRYWASRPGGEAREAATGAGPGDDGGEGIAATAASGEIAGRGSPGHEADTPGPTGP